MTHTWQRDLKLIRFLPMLVMMTAIFIMSSQTGDSLNLPDIANIDKLYHALEYGTLAASVLFGLHPASRSLRPAAIAGLTILFCAAYGTSDEFHQIFVPLRDASLADIMADTSGAVLIATLWWYINKSCNHKSGQLMEEKNHADL
ncbi:MAG TPA: teicoplanin resistance protein VanZ [Desulfobacterales bacterium]|nr:teicoplanin resistance protein VanZ [Desulfobacterales bacterium]